MVLLLVGLYQGIFSSVGRFHIMGVFLLLVIFITGVCLLLFVFISGECSSIGRFISGEFFFYQSVYIRGLFLLLVGS